MSYGESMAEASTSAPDMHSRYRPAKEVNGPMCGVPVPSKQPAVLTAMGRLSYNVAEVLELINMLEARLQPVLRSEPEPPMKDELRDGLVPLSQAITESVVSLSKSKDRLTSILNRLEL